MKIVNCLDIAPVPSKDLGMTGAKNLAFRFLVHAGDGAQGFSMLLIELAPEGHTPEHSHDYEEELFVRTGSGEVKTEDGRVSIRTGDVLYIPSGEKHQFLNTGPQPLELICALPIKKE
jgi:quercetin dioxygenase-like cupin family protein